MLAERFASMSIKDEQWGVVGDGVHDDSAGIRAAVAALGDNETLYFPPGRYRFAMQSPSGGAAIVLDQVNRAAIWAAPGAVLVMDNLNGSGAGTSHGVSGRGASTGITIKGLRVEWATRPSSRSTGDAFHFLGYPKASGVTAGWTGSTGTLADVKLIDCEAVNAPQCGAIFMGCDRPRVENLLVQSTWGDGCHFNACRDPKIEGYRADRPGDDGLAFVTYYAANGDAPTSDVYGTQVGPFALATVDGNDWANGNAEASGVQVRDSATANGIRIAGAFAAAVEGFTVTGCVAGVVLDSGEAGGSFAWTYLASHGCQVGAGVIEGAQIGIYARVYTSDSADSSIYWRGAVTFHNLTIRACTNYSVRVEGAMAGQNTVIAGVKLRAIEADGADVSISSLRDGRVIDVHVKGADLRFFGQDVVLSGALSTLPRHNVTVDDCSADGGSVTFQDVRGYTIGTIRSLNSPDTGIDILRIVDSSLDEWNVTLAHRGNTGTSRGFMVNKALNFHAERGMLVHDGNFGGTWRSVEFGGGDATDVAGSGVDLGRITYLNAINQAVSNVVVQGGGFGPVDYIYRMRFKSSAEGVPQWRYETASNGTPWVNGAA